MALLMALLVVALLSAIIVDYAYEMRVEASLIGNRGAQFRAQLAAESAAALGMSLLLDDMDNLDGVSGPEFDALTDAWARGVPYEEYDDGVLRCSVTDEFGKLNVNALLRPDGETRPVVEDALRALFIARGAEEDPVDAILDWIDPDEEQRTTGAEADHYAGMQVAVGCKNGPLDSIEELLMVRGMTPDLFFGDPAQDQAPLTELLTVYGDPSGKVNVNTARRELLDAFGEALGRPGLGEIVIQAREEAPFESVQDLQARGILPTQTANPSGESGIPTELEQPATVAGSCYRIHGDGMVNDCKVRVTAYVWRDPAIPGGFRILDWRTVQ